MFKYHVSRASSRDHSYYLLGNRRRRTTALRMLILILVIASSWRTVHTWLEALQYLHTQNSSGGCAPSAIHSHAHSSSWAKNLPQGIPSMELDETRVQTGAEISRMPQTPIRVQYVADDKVGPRSPERFRFALEKVLSLSPDELRMKDLLKQIEGTGEEKLRDTGLRARSFKSLFEAWEALHLGCDEQAIHVHDDVIQYLRRHPEVVDHFDMDFPHLIHAYETFRSFITRLSTLLFPWTSPFFSDHMSLHAQLYSGGRGLVFSAGDGQARYLLSSIPAIRKLGCELPIEVMYLGDGDLSEDFRADLEALPGVTTRDLSQMVNDKGWTLAGWAGKPFAILLSSFREVIFIDADSLFFRNPEVLFQDPSYTETGALFFKDRLMMPESRKRWLQRILPKPISTKARRSRLWTGESGHMQESGVVVVDKWRHFVALLQVTRMNGPDRDGNQDEGRVGVYDMVYGDKETFWLGWELVGDAGYAFHGGNAGIMGMVNTELHQDNSIHDSTSQENSDEQKEREMDAENPKSFHDSEPANFTICAPQLLHLDKHDRPLWFNGWLLPNKYTDDKKQVPRFDAYLMEPPEVKEPGAWQLGEANICCLTSDRVFKFTQAEKDVLDTIIATAKHVGALEIE